MFIVLSQELGDIGAITKVSKLPCECDGRVRWQARATMHRFSARRGVGDLVADAAGAGGCAGRKSAVMAAATSSAPGYAALSCVFSGAIRRKKHS